jgi:hypothetical protein
MVEILRKAMELKTSSETLLQLESKEGEEEEEEEEEEEKDKHLPSTNSLDKISDLKGEVDQLVEQCRDHVEHHHLFAEIPTSKRQYQ